MKINRSYILVFALLAAITLWFVSGSKNKPAPTIDNSARTEQNAIPKVVTNTIYPQEHEKFLKLYGRTESDKEVKVKAQTAGLVVRTPVQEGRFVKRGTLLCLQDVDARKARLDQARALLRTRELEYEAAKRLVKKGFNSETQSAAAKAAYDGARASVSQAEIELENINIRAPFDGIVERQIAEVGEYLGPGQPCALLIDMNPLVVSGEVTEKQVAGIKVGQQVQITLATRQKLQGKVRLIETKANPTTRTFRIEVAVPNKDYTLKAGVTANLKLSAGKTLAHLIPASVLTLNDEGAIGVRVVDYNEIVQFIPVTQIDETTEGVWVTGLPESTNLIIRGQGYVRQGVKVEIESLTDFEQSNAGSSSQGGLK